MILHFALTCTIGVVEGVGCLGVVFLSFEDGASRYISWCNGIGREQRANRLGRVVHRAQHVQSSVFYQHSTPSDYRLSSHPLPQAGIRFVRGVEYLGIARLEASAWLACADDQPFYSSGDQPYLPTFIACVFGAYLRKRIRIVWITNLYCEGGNSL